MSRVQHSGLVSSTSDRASLFLLSPAALRPMTSHARIEGGVLFSKSGRDGTQSVPKKKKFLLPKLKSGAMVDTDSDTYRQKMWAGQANILVTVRLRPLLSHDRDREEIVKVVSNKEVVVLTRTPTSMVESTMSANSPVRHRYNMHPLRKPRHASAAPIGASGTRNRERRYAFDYVFTPKDGQEEVYQHTTKFLMHGVLNGFNATVFAYGCTGAGKTYTMLGTPEEPGIMAKTLEDLFRNIERVHSDPAGRIKYRVTVSFLEVYNENIRDLLAASGSSASQMSTAEFLDLREDPIRGPVVAGLSEVEASNAQAVMKLLRKGNKYRSQEATAANAVSSRSHAVLQVHVEQQEKMNSEDDGVSPELSDDKVSDVEIKFGKLSLVDLAGSERAAVTQNRGQRLLEGANINRSLLALGNCINALGEKGASASRSFVPYRDSKLTRLLKDSLGGNCRTVMIANVSLAASSVEETLNTLKYANRAKNIKTTLKRNVVDFDQSTSNQSSLVANLQDEIATLKKALLQQQEQHEARLSRETELSNNNTEEEEWKTVKLREARQYITDCFHERRRLRHALLKVEHQIRIRAQELQVQQDRQLLAGQSSKSTPEPEVSDPNPQDVSCSTSPSTLVAPESPRKGHNEQLVVFARERELLQQKLARNERTMDEFRRGIEQSPLMERNELIREVLLMEYRIGDLEMDKMQLQTLRDFQLNGRAERPDENNNNLGGEDDLQQFDISPSILEDHDDDRIHLPEILPRRKMGSNRSRIGFFEGLREHLYPEKSNSNRDDEVGHTTAASPVSSRRNWGLHLNNASLPYIRLKKKNPVPLYVEPSSSALKTEVQSPEKSSSMTSPYLKSLKNRRKSRRGSKTSKTSAKR